MWLNPVQPMGFTSVMLQSAAQGHSDWMAEHSRFSHRGHHGSSPHDRIKQTGFSEPATAENIYKFPSARDRLHRDLRFIGVGITERGGYVYATQNFGG